MQQPQPLDMDAIGQQAMVSEIEQQRQWALLRAVNMAGVIAQQGTRADNGEARIKELEAQLAAALTVETVKEVIAADKAKREAQPQPTVAP